MRHCKVWMGLLSAEPRLCSASWANASKTELLVDFPWQISREMLGKLKLNRFWFFVAVFVSFIYLVFQDKVSLLVLVVLELTCRLSSP